MAESTTTSESISRIRYLPDGRRQGRLLTLMGTDWDGYVYLSDVYISAGNFLAFKHLQEQSGEVMPELPALLEGCDFDFTYEQRETIYDPTKAVTELVDATTQQHQQQHDAAEEEVVTPPAEELIWEDENSVHHQDNQQNDHQETTEVAHATTSVVPTANNSTATNITDEATTTTINAALSPEGTPEGTTLVIIPTTTTDNHHDDQNNRRQLNEIEATNSSTSYSTTIHDAVPTNDAGASTTTTSEEEDDWQHPFAMTGASYSFVTLPLAIVGEAMELPLVSGSATSTELDRQGLFGRTIPTNRGDAHAILQYYHSINVEHVACIYIRDSWGNSYHADLQQEARAYSDLKLLSFPYVVGEEVSALQQLKQSGYRHVFAILWDWKTMLEVAYDEGVIANANYSWIAAELIEWTQESFALNRTDSTEDDEDPHYEYKWAQALNGIGQISLHVPEHAAFEAAMQQFALNQTLRQDFVNHFHEPSLWESLEWTPPDASLWTNMNYDAVIALGIAACRTPGLFTGPELYQTMLGVEFEGASGNVRFDPVTGNRAVESVQYRIDNIYLNDTKSDDEYIRFTSNMAALVGQGHVEHLHPFVYYDNTTNMPVSLPPVQDYDYNLVPTWAHIVGLTMAGLVMVTSLGWMGWIYWYRKISVIQASQPIFLGQLCVGTFIMASAVIPMSFQSTTQSRGLDVACMSVPWLVFLGFVTVLSALSSKAWRLNKLMSAGMRMRRIQVEAVDVIWPFVCLMTLNVSLLLAWTLVTPWTYVREPNDNNVDMFGRSVESYGSCQSEDGKAVYFIVPLVVVDLVGLAVATYHSYKGRKLPIAFSESSYLAISMASLLESLLLGGPILFVVLEDPTASYVVGSALLCISCMTILIPVFVPKYWSQQQRGRHRGTNSSIMTSVNVRPGISQQYSQLSISRSKLSNDGSGLHDDVSRFSNDDMSTDGCGVASVGAASGSGGGGSGFFSESGSWGKMKVTRHGEGGGSALVGSHVRTAPGRIPRSEISSRFTAASQSRPFQSVTSSRFTSSKHSSKHSDIDTSEPFRVSSTKVSFAE